MRKIVALFMALVMSALFAACSSSQGSSSNAALNKSESTGATSNGLQIDDSQLENLGKPKHLMSVTTEELVKAIDTGLSTDDKKLSEQVPRIQDFKDSEMGDVNENQYSLGNGILLSLFNSKENEKITRIEFFIDTSNATKESMKYYAKCGDAVIKFLDGDSKGNIENTLDLSNIDQNEFKYAQTEKYNYSYAVQSGTDVLMIKPAGE